MHDSTKRVAKHRTEANYARRERRWGGEGKYAALAARAFNRAVRREGRESIAQALKPEAPEAYVAPWPEGQKDAHVRARFYMLPSGERVAYGTDYEGCGCALCLVDAGVVGWCVAMSILAQSKRPCDLGLTLADFVDLEPEPTPDPFEVYQESIYARH